MKNTKLTDWIKIYDDMLSEDFCDEYTKMIHDTMGGQGLIVKPDTDHRRCDIYEGMDSHNESFGRFKVVIRKIFERYKRELDNNNLHHLRVLEAPNIICYSNDDTDGVNRFGTHCDTWNMATASRQLSLILYLNDVDEGGKTTFTDLGIEVKPKKGRVLIFPPFHMFTHTGESPISNPKYIIVAWIHFGGTGHHYRTHSLY